MSDDIKEARSREETFVSHVSGKTKTPKLSQKSKKSFIRRCLPLFSFFALLAIGVSFIFSSQSLMPFALVNRFIEEFNTIGISSTLRSDNLLDIQLSSPNTSLALSSAQKTAFKDTGITPVELSLGSPTTALVFEESRGKTSVVVAKSVKESASSSSILAATGANTSVYSTSEALNLASFKEKYASASKTWRGGNSGWYDSIADLTEARLAISRSRYANWASVVLNSGTKEAWKNLAKVSRSASDAGIADHGTYVDTDDSGAQSTTSTSGTVDSTSLTSQTTLDGVRSALNSKITNVAKLVATAGCAGVEILSAIHTVMSAQQSIQYLNLATGFFESVQRVQAGVSDGTPMNEYNERLTAVDPETGKTALESAGIIQLFSGTPISADDASVKSTNFENLMSSLGSLTGDLNFTAQAFEKCSYIRMGVAAANFATTILNFIPVLGQATQAIHIVAKVVGRLALGVAVGAIVSFIVPKIVESVAKNIISDVATEWTGMDLGNALTSGANKYLGGNFQTGGGSPSSEALLQAYRQAQAEVIAENARLTRATLSPFDLSSRYTFLGSIVYALMPIATSTSIGGLAQNSSSLVKNSVVALLPTASAVAETNLISTVGSCPLLESVGIVGDAYCNPYFITDKSTLSVDPASIESTVASLSSDNFSSTSVSGAKTINPSSNLGKYIKFCGQRNSQFGVADANIANQIVAQPSSLISNLPLIGDLAQIVSAATQAENMPWISGSACVASSDNPLWAENQYYQRYVEDQRLLESAGIISQSPVTAMLKQYYTENPLDNSYEGVLVRYSGMTKNDVIATLDTIEALQFIANYNPAERTYAIISVCQANNSCVTPKSHLSHLASPLAQTLYQAPVKPRILLLVPSLATNHRKVRQSQTVA